MAVRIPAGGEPPVQVLVDWLMIYTRGGRRTPWLLVTGVPSTVKRTEVLERLGTWRRWGQYAPAPDGRLSLKPLKAAEAERGPVGVARDGEVTLPASRVDWATLAPAQLKMQVDLSADEHVVIVQAARQSGMTIKAFMAYASAAAAKRVLFGDPE